MSFEVAAEAYDEFMGRYSVLLAPQMADIAQVRAGQRVLDVGCGPGALMAELVTRLGAAAVAAVDPSPPFVAAARARYPGVEVSQAPAERLPFPDRSFDAALAQLVVHFMSDPVAGLAEMARVTRRDGVIAACVWDHAGDQGPLSLFWRRRGSSIPRSTMSRSSRALVRATSPSCSWPPACARSRRRHSRSVASTRASRRGGNRSPSALAQRAPTSSASPRNGKPSCAKHAAPWSRRDRSCSPPGPGRHAVSYDACVDTRPVRVILAGVSDAELREVLLRFEAALAARNPDGIDGGLLSLIADDFVEFGRSGRVWTRDSIRELLEGSPGPPVPIDRFEVAELGDGVALVTYRAALANRSSVWVRRDGRWQLRFHQGTPIGG